MADRYGRQQTFKKVFDGDLYEYILKILDTAAKRDLTGRIRGERAAELREVMIDYARMDRKAAENYKAGDAVDIVLTLRLDEHLDIHYLLGAAESGGIAVGRNIEYKNISVIAERTRKYWAEYDSLRSERNRAKAESRLRAKEIEKEKEERLAEKIRIHISECRKSGTRPLKKAIDIGDCSRAMLDRAWRKAVAEYEAGSKMTEKT